MFIFRLFFSLIGLGLTLLLLPLKLVKLPLALVLAPLSAAFSFLLRHAFLVIIFIVILLVWMQFRSDNVKLPELAPAASEPVAAAPKGANNVPIVQPVTRKENGDSDFATDVYSTMTPPEQQQYSTNFYWAMNNLPDGDVHSWSFYNIAGSIRAIDTFANNEGVRCRHFTEVLKVHTVQQTISGSACDNGGSWCKLKLNATPACNLGGQGSGFLHNVGSSLKNLF